MTKEQILEKSFNTLLKPKFGSIIGEFSEANTNNGYEWVFTAMEEYKEQELAKEREKANKLVEALDVIYKNTQDKLIYEIAKQSLTEYEKL